MGRHLGLVWLALAGCYLNNPAPPRQTPLPPPSTPTHVATAPHLPGTNRVQFDFDDDGSSLIAAGFTNNKGGTSRFARGRLEIDTTGYEEWSQPQEWDGGFVEQAANGPWAVEARFAETTPCSRGGTGMWIHDGRYFVHFAVTDHEIVLAQQRVDIGSTQRQRTYRIELANDTVTVFVDGRQVFQTPAVENLATVTLMFGAMGGGCARNTSTWDYIAYETTSGPGAMWPPRDTWHAGTKASPLITAIQSQLPSVAVPTLDDRDVPCLAIFAIDGAVRDLLPLAYDAQRTLMPAQALRHLPPLTKPYALGDARRTIDDWTQVRRVPVCDPAPGMRCPPPQQPLPRAPVPAIAPDLRAAVIEASKWSLHPVNAEKSTALAAKAYATAVAAGIPGAAGAVKRFQQRLDSLASHPKHCGL